MDKPENVSALQNLLEQSKDIQESSSATLRNLILQK